ncbi:galactose mutarotase-like domain-containing protein [Thamnidium elegans]|nr:galactose mutarotase-like domain-containing protein [Thamnidium elegans]
MRYISIVAAITLVLYCHVDAVPNPTAKDISTMTSRRLGNIHDASSTSASNILTWSSTLKSSGTWSNVDYTSGCEASSQLASCTKIQARAFAKVTSKLRTISVLTGANLLEVSSIGINLALLNNDSAMLKVALDAFYGGVFINSTPAGDGIQSDGSFMQHAGLLYNGNYGKDYINDLLSVFIETKGTNMVPPPDVQTAFETLLSGTEWMIMADTKLNKLLWQYSVIGRMVSFRHSDGQASGGVAIDISKISRGSEGWLTESKIDAITDRLNAPHTGDANQGDLVGTRYFYNADYMVHRAPNYVTTMKMYSSRTINSECLNVQNPFGFHLSDGSIFNYLTGDEYLDTFGAWNWDLVPGITVDYRGTELRCNTVKKKGLKSFVGGIGDGNTGVAVMDFENPVNNNLHFQKTVFFFPSSYAVQIGPVASKNTSAQLVTVLDQRKRNGDIYLAGKLRNTDTTYSSPKTNTIWHDKIGYYFPTAEVLFVDSKPKNASWEAIGISSGSEKQQLFTSYIKHDQKTTSGLLSQYIVQPNIEQAKFHDNVNTAFHASNPQVSAAYSKEDVTMGLAFWSAGTFETPWNVIVTTDGPIIMMLRELGNKKYRLIAADASQTLEKVKVTITIANVKKSVTYIFPVGSERGKKMTKTIDFAA